MKIIIEIEYPMNGYQTQLHDATKIEDQIELVISVVTKGVVLCY